MVEFLKNSQNPRVSVGCTKFHSSTRVHPSSLERNFGPRDPGQEVPLEQNNLLGSRNFHEPKKTENTSAPHIRLHHSSFSFAPMGKILEKASC